MAEYFKCRGFSLPLGQKTYIMGILNVTPDSFSDGGKYYDPEKAVERAFEMVENGADIIDVGGESTRPGFTPISAEEELGRVIPVVKILAKELNVPISVDTTKSIVAEKALEAGAHIINDVWGLQKDPELAGIISKYDAGVVVMHNKEDTVYTDLIRHILNFLKKSVEIAINAGIEQDHIAVDPGIGFGKTFEHNIEVMRNLDALKELKLPILLGTSRKSFIGKILDLPVTERVEGTAATVALGIAKGVDIVRVHDVLEMKRVAKVSDAIVRGMLFRGMALDKIILRNMKFFAYHGVLPEERTKGQYFIIDVELYINLATAGKSDNLEHTVNYSDVYNEIKTIVLQNKFMLIEKLAETIAQSILDKYKNVIKTKVLVKKPQAPIDGEFDWMGVEIERTRN